VDAEFGVIDHQGFTWTLELKARARCSGAEESDIGITFVQLRDYGQPGGNATYLNPPPNTYVKRNVVLPAGLYEVTVPAVACRSDQPEPDGHSGDHGQGAEGGVIGRIDLPRCRSRSGPRGSCRWSRW
jgi:hypothetical protein